MKKNLLITSLFTMLSLLVYGQKGRVKGPDFDIMDFNKKAEIAEWLYKYDVVAWWTSDSVMKQDKKELERLGQEWFCFEGKENTWHAVYGKFENEKFDLVFHYIVDSIGKVSRTTSKVDTLLLNSYSRALRTANNQIKLLKDTVNLRFNQFIRKNEDKTFSIWILPAFQPNYYAIYGGEFIYTIDQSGTKVLKDESYYQGEFKGFKVDKPREIWLNYRDTQKPTLGAVFFVWYYKKYFTKIVINNSKSFSTIMKSKDSYTWVHGVKEQEKKRKK